MRTHLLGAVALVCTMAALTACGGDSKNPSTRAGSQGTTTPSAPPGSAGSSASPGGSTASPGAGTSGSPAAGTSGSPAAGTSASASPTATTSPYPKAPLDATLAKQCATPGSTQTLKIQTSPPPKGSEMIVVFDNLYSDGYDGGKYGGIEKNGRTDSEGRYSNTWVIALNAPLGKTRVDIAVAGKPGTNTKQIYWNVQRTC